MNNEQKKILEKIAATAYKNILKEFYNITVCALEKFPPEEKTNEFLLTTIGEVLSAVNKQIIKAIMEGVDPKTFAAEYVDFFIKDLTNETEKIKNKFLK